MTHIITEKLHWVFFIDREGEIKYYLGDQDNKRLKCPKLVNLTGEEKRSLRLENIFIEEDKDGKNTYASLYSGQTSKCEMLITAPLYIKEGKKCFCRCGTYTEEDKPEEIKRINEIVSGLIPNEKIYKEGNYVDNIL